MLGRVEVVGRGCKVLIGWCVGKLMVDRKKVGEVVELV